MTSVQSASRGIPSFGTMTTTIKSTDDPNTHSESDSSDLASIMEDNGHDHWRIALYYCYIDIVFVDEHVQFHQRLCDENDLQGRIRVSSEGINGVLSGRVPALTIYEERLRAELVRLVPSEKAADHKSWELDVKYCELRKELPVKAQLFDSLICKETNAVVSLFEPDNSGNTEKKKQGFSKQSNRRRRRQQQRREQQELVEEALPFNLRELSQKVSTMPGACHLAPREWNEKLLNSDNAILLDCRNIYESNVGHFSTDKAPTVLTNTRKYSDLPKVLAQSKDTWAHKKQIFMYCTGGVRCEQASKFVQALVATESKSSSQSCEVYQLHGGIQRYLEHFAKEEETEPARTSEGPCLYKGKNFVFDPRRTDPMLDRTSGDSIVGRCCRCDKPHDDYDNGHAPCENREARCCKCRILLLVCNTCRETVQCWGEDHKQDLPNLYCGKDACRDYQVTGENPVSIAES